jgi:hypothetical protein
VCFVSIDCVLFSNDNLCHEIEKVQNYLFSFFPLCVFRFDTSRFRELLRKNVSQVFDRPRLSKSVLCLARTLLHVAKKRASFVCPSSLLPFEFNSWTTTLAPWLSPQSILISHLIISLLSLIAHNPNKHREQNTNNKTNKDINKINGRRRRSDCK